MRDIRIAAVIFSAQVGNIAANLERITFWTRKAAAADAAIVCFPELSVTGYSVKNDIRDIAEPVPGPATDFLQQLAANEAITILAGLAEKDAENRLYATHLVVSPHGITYIYRKTHLGPPERDLFTASDTAPVFESCGITFGIQLCYDVHFPELATIMALKGAEAIFIPHASPHGAPDEKLKSWMRHLPARAYDNSLFVIACNLCGENSDGLSFPGVGLVIGPSGAILQSAAGTIDQMILADLKARDLEDVRGHRMKYFLPNRRPELYMI